MKDKIYSQKSVLLKILLFGLLFSVLHILLERVLSYASADVALMHLTRPLNIGIILCDAVGFFIGYALFSSLFFTHSETEKKSDFIPPFLLLPAITVFRHVGNWLVFLMTENVTSAIDLRLSFLAVISALLIEFFQHGVILLLGLFVLFPRCATPKITALTTSAVMLAVNLLSRLISDVEYGAPTSAAEAWVMVAYYLFDVLLYGAIGYISMLLILRHKTKTSAE